MWWIIGVIMLWTTVAVVPGSASLAVEKSLRTGRVTVYTVTSQDREGKTPPEAKNQTENLLMSEYCYIMQCQ